MLRPYEKATPSTVNARARHHPAVRSATAISRWTSLVRHLRQVLHECVDLLWRQRIAEVGGHDPGLVAGRDLLVGVDDRLLDERRVLALEDLVEVRAGGPGRAGVGEGVAGAAGRGARVGVALGEQLLGVGRPARLGAAATAAG